MDILIMRKAIDYLLFKDSEEFAVENEDIFMQINNLSLASNADASIDDDEALVTNVGLPSARRLRGGASIVAKGRHGINGSNAEDRGSLSPSAMSNNYSNPGSRYAWFDAVHCCRGHFPPKMNP